MGALKAMGASNMLLAGMLLLQSMTVGLIGFGIGIGMTALFGLTIAKSGQPPFLMDAAFVFEALAAVLLICALAALFGIRRVAKLEPAIVFRG